MSPSLSLHAKLIGRQQVAFSILQSADLRRLMVITLERLFLVLTRGNFWTTLPPSTETKFDSPKLSLK